MRLPISHRVIPNRSSDFFDKNMSSSNAYSIELPYLGEIFLGKSPLNLTSFQKPLHELYLPYYHEHFHNERRLIISEYDILIFEPNAAIKGKRTFIYSNFQSIVDIQILKLSVMINNTENQLQAAFLPIGCEQQERFHSLYSIINQSKYNRHSTSYHPPLLLFILRKSGVGDSSSLFDCHVFIVHRESTAFELSDMIRKLIIKRTMSPLLTRRTTLIRVQNNNKEVKIEKQIEQDLPISTMKYQQIDKQNNHLLTNVNLNDVVHSTTNPLSSSSLLINNLQHSLLSHDTSKVLTMNSDIHRMSSPNSTLKQRHFIKASKLLQDESDEIVNDLMNIVANEKLKNQISIKRHASFDQTSYPNNNTMNKKRYFHNKKRLLNSIPTINNTSNQQKINPRIDGHLLRPHILVNRYGDIGNYVPKFLREDNTTMRSSDSNENIFFRSSNGQLLNSFLKLDFLSKNSINENNNHYQSTPCLNQDQNIYSLVQQLQKNRTKSFINIYQDNTNESKQISDMEINDDDHQVPHVLKSMEDVVNGIKIHPFISTSNSYQQPLKSNPKRAGSFTIADTELPTDYRQYLRHTDQGEYLYGEKQRQQTTLEHSLGYYP